MPFVPPNLTVIRDSEGSASSEGDWYGEIFEEYGDDLVFVGFGIHKGQCIVIVHHHHGDSFSPDVEHCSVDDIGKGTLWVERDGFADSVLISTTTKEVSFSAS